MPARTPTTSSFGRFSGRQPANRAGRWPAALERDFGGFAPFRAVFAQAALAFEGQGFAFLCLTGPGSEQLEILILPNNCSVLPLGKPGVLICDLWEHAWAGDHPTRAAWLDAFWTIVDWRECGARYEALRSGRTPA